MKNTLINDIVGSVGTPLILACYISTISDIYPTWVYILIGLLFNVCIGFLSFTFLALDKKALDIKPSFKYSILDIIGTWHGTSICITDISLLFIMSQSLSRGRESPMHIPTEIIYSPIILVSFFSFICIDRSLKNRKKREYKKKINDGETNDTLGILCILFGLASLLITCSYSRPYINQPDDYNLGDDIKLFLPNDLSYKSNNGISMISFFFMSLIYSIPSNLVCMYNKERASKPMTAYHIISITVLKCIIQSVCIVLYKNSIPPSTLMSKSLQDQYGLHDYYSLRIISQDNTDGLDGERGLLPPTKKLFIGLIVRFYCLLSSCRWMIYMKDLIDNWINNHGIPVKDFFTEIHELFLAYSSSCVMIGLISVTRQATLFTSDHTIYYGMQYEYHSMGLMWGMASMTIIMILIGICYLSHSM